MAHFFERMDEYILAAKRIGLVGIATLLVTLSPVILLPVLTKALPVTDYGSWSLITATIVLIPLLVTLGLPNAMVRFLAVSTNKQDNQEIFYSMGFVTLVTSLLTFGALFLLAKPIATGLFHSDATIAVTFAASVFFACVNWHILTYFRASLQTKKYTTLNLLQAYLLVALVAFFVLSGYGLYGAVVGLLLQQLFVFVIMSLVVLREIGVAVPTFVNTKSHLAFGLPLVPAYVSSWVVNSSDRYLIGLLVGTAAVGYYTPGYALGYLMYVFAAPLTLMLSPIVSKYYDMDKTDDVRTAMSFSFKWYLAAAIPSVFALSILSKPLLLLLSTPQIATNGFIITPFAALAWTLIGACEIFILPLMLTKKTAFTGAVWIVSAALNFGLNLVLIPYLGIIGAALTTLVAALCAFVSTMVYSLRHFTFDLNKTFILKSVIASVIPAPLLFLWGPHTLISLLLSICSYAVSYFAILLLSRGVTLTELRFFLHALTGAR
ncbi:MAG: oligosaccharide flippase family protein [Halobacteriota archaeon]